MNVVLYMRYSSDRQTEQSIEGQQRVCEAFCEREGYTIVGKYIDRATSAFKDTDKRTQFQQMIRDSEKQLWEAVVVYKLDRFARNRYDSATYKARLKKNGVRVVSATENISENPEGVILEAVLEGMAEFYSKELSQKITRGMYESAMKCHSVGGSVPLGYVIKDHKLVVEEKEAVIVKELFFLYAEGKTVSEICEIFNSKGYRTKKGQRFNKNSFNNMLRNERYIGVYTYKDVRIEGGVPAIIDVDLFEKVKMRLKKNATAPSRGKATVDYLLSQKLFCGHCGARMIGESGKSKTGKKYYYYACPTNKKDHRCNKKAISKDIIEQYVAAEAVSLLTADTIEKLADMAVKENEKDVTERSLVPAIRAELEEVEKSIANLLKVLEKGVASESLIKRLDELELHKKDIEKRLAEAEADIIVLKKEHIVWWLGKFANGDIEDHETRKSIIDLFVNSVTVWDEDPERYKITILFNLTPGNEKTITIPTSKGSDLTSYGPPTEYKPNSIFFLGSCFGYTVIRKRTV